MENADIHQKFIDVDKVILDKNPKLYKILPRFIIKYIKRIFHQNDLNNDLWQLRNHKGIDKFDEFLRMKNISLTINGEENLKKDKRYVFASNHPLGGPDGVIFGSAIRRMFPNIRFLINDVLMNIPDMEDLFIPINTLGTNSREYTIAIDKLYASENEQVLIFPAGMVSRKYNGVIKDPVWNKSFVVKAKKHKRDIVPVFISGTNSNFFYNLALIRRKLKIKANLEMFYLIDEFYKHKNETINIFIGKPISYEKFDNSKKPMEWAEYIKEITYSLPKEYNLQ